MLLPTALPFTSGGILITTWAVALLGIATIAVLLRFWSRILTKIPVGLDDWLALAALIPYCIIVVIGILATKYGGLGYEETIVLEKAPQNLNFLLLMTFAYTWGYSISSQLIKLTVLAFYWRIFPTKFIHTSCIVISSVSILFLVSMMFVNGLQCRPITYYWMQVGDGTCINLTAYYFGVSVINFIIDLCTLMLPLREVSRLQAPFWRRVGICGVFFLGSIVVVASLARMVLMHQLEVHGLSNMTSDMVPGWAMTVIEVGLGIIGACLPTLVPVYRKLRYGSTRKRTTPNGQHTPYQPGRKTRTTSPDLSLSGRVSVGESKPSHEPFLPDERTASFDSFEMLSSPPSNSGLEQQADKMIVSGYHDAEQGISIYGSSLPDHERPLDAGYGIYVRHEVVWTESVQPQDTHDWR